MVTELVSGMQAKGGLRNYVGLQRETPAWHKRLTSQFDNDTRLVGPVISCEGTPYLGDPSGEWRTVPHVQSHAIAVDQVSFSIWSCDTPAAMPCCAYNLLLIAGST